MHRSVARINLNVSKQSIEELRTVTSSEQLVCEKELRKSKSKTTPCLTNFSQHTQKFLGSYSRHCSSIHLTATCDDATAECQLRRACSRPVIYSSCARPYRDTRYTDTPIPIIGEVKLCRKGATTMLTMSSSMSLPPIEVSSADSLTQVRPKVDNSCSGNHEIMGKLSNENLMKLRIDEGGILANVILDDSVLGSSIKRVVDVHRVESLPYTAESVLRSSGSVSELIPRFSQRAVTPEGMVKELHEAVYERRSATWKDRNSDLPTEVPNDLAVGEHSTSDLPKCPNELQDTASRMGPEGIKITDSEVAANVSGPVSSVLKAQVENVLTLRSEKQTLSSNHMATDFSRALLQNLLQRSHDSGLDIEASPSYLEVASCESAGAMTGNLDVSNPTIASVTQLAAKIVQRINEVKEGQSQQSHVQKMKGLFEKLMSTSPILTTRLSRLRDLCLNYSTQPESSVSGCTSPCSADVSNDPQNNAILKFSSLEKELAKEEAVLEKMMAELEALKEKQVQLQVGLNTEAENLMELQDLRRSLSSEIVDPFDTHTEGNLQQQDN